MNKKGGTEIRERRLQFGEGFLKRVDQLVGTRKDYRDVIFEKLYTMRAIDKSLPASQNNEEIEIDVKNTPFKLRLKIFRITMDLGPRTLKHTTTILVLDIQLI